MVRGLDKFKEYFAGFDGNYVLIGGAASNLLEEENRLVPRATKDLDIILVVEALTSSFVKRFWQFVRDAGYVHRQKGTDRSEFYRFYQPTDANYPAQLELLSRKPDLIELPKDIVIGPIPVGEELSSLSAIMLNDEYYHFTIANSIMLSDVHIANNVALIPLKAKAYINLRQARADGQTINSGDITKHKNDVIRLGLTLDPETHVSLPTSIREDMADFFSLVQDDLPHDDFIGRIGAAGTDVNTIVKTIKTVFDIN